MSYSRNSKIITIITRWSLMAMLRFVCLHSLYTGNKQQRCFVLMWQGRSKSLSEFFYNARNATSMYFDEEPSTLDVEVRLSSVSCTGLSGVYCHAYNPAAGCMKQRCTFYAFLRWWIFMIGHESTFWVSCSFFIRICVINCYTVCLCVCLYFWCTFRLF